MGRKRNKENLTLPSRWRFTRNAYYYQVPVGKEYLWEGKQTYKLGNTFSEAFAEWLKRFDQTPSTLYTLNHLADRYVAEVLPAKAIKSQEVNNNQLLMQHH